MKVLIADDSAFMRSILKSIVDKSKWAGAEIIEAIDGKDTIEKFKTGKPDLLLLDIVMPELSGIDVLKDIGYAAQAVVIVSSVDDQAVIDEAKQHGASTYITKPFDAQKVIEILNAIPGQPGQATQ